jgi:hypothetical protein
MDFSTKTRNLEPALQKKDWIRRLEGETPEMRLSLYEAVVSGFDSTRLIFEERSGTKIEQLGTSVPITSRLQVIHESLLPETGVGILITIIRELMDDCGERALALVQSIADAFYIHENDSLHVDTLHNAFVSYVLLDMFGQLEEWFKFQTTYLSAWLLRQQELPEIIPIVTRPGFVCGGKFYRLMRQLLRGDLNETTISWAGTVLALKRGALPLRPTEVAKSLEKHRSTLERQAKSISTDQKLRHVHSLIGMCVDKVFDKCDSVSSLNGRMPSVSSHYGWSRAEGGALGRVAALIRKQHGCMAGFSKELAGIAERSPGVAHSLGSPMELDVWVPSYSYDLAGTIAQMALEESLDCDVHVVLEPMKARIITSGPPLRYHICRMIQKIVHGEMRKRQEYSLIGGPVTSEILGDNFKDLSSIQRRYCFVSADYSAATDNIEGALSREYCKQVSDHLGLDAETNQIFSESMVGHTLHYPAEYGGNVSQQSNGQLMGSPTSFPGLCLINLATLWAAWSEYEAHRGLSSSYQHMLRELRPLVNGDDLLFIAPPGFIPLWRQYVKAVGLVPSPGKNYVSEKFFVINSTFFMFNIEEGWSPYRSGAQVSYRSAFHFIAKRVHWVGSGLLKGQARVLADTRRNDQTCVEANVDFGQLRSQLDWVLDWNGHEGPRERSLDVWFRNMSNVLMNCQLSWRLPVALGGLGLPIGGASRPQLVLANLIMKTWRFDLVSKFQARPKIGNSTTVAQLRSERILAEAFGLRKYVKAYMPEVLVKLPNSAYMVKTNVELEAVIPADLHGNVYKDSLCEGGTHIARVILPQHDVSVSPFVAGLTMLESEELPRLVSDFNHQMNEAIKRFNGGPATLEECLLWQGTLAWGGRGKSHFLPHPEFCHRIDNLQIAYELAREEIGDNEVNGEHGDLW